MRKLYVMAFDARCEKNIDKLYQQFKPVQKFASVYYYNGHIFVYSNQIFKVENGDYAKECDGNAIELYKALKNQRLTLHNAWMHSQAERRFTRLSAEL